MKNFGWKIGRHVNGITINGLEWLLDDDGDIMFFDRKQDGIDFLHNHDITDEDIEDMRFYIETNCIHCGEHLELSESDLAKDDLGYYYYHSDCGSSFDVLASE